MKRALILVLVLILAAALVLNGCGKKGPAYEKATDKETLVVAMGGDARSLDPHMTNDQPSARVMRQIYNTLMNQTEDLQIEKGLAKEYTVVSDTQFDFVIHSGVKFHNGEELKASDVKFTLERMISTNAPAMFLISPLDRVEVTGDYSFSIHLKFPFGPFITHLAHTATSILNEKAVLAAGEDYGRNPVGTGPFKFVSWQSGDHILLERFDGYYEGQAKSKFIRFRVIPEDANRAIAIETGEADIVFDVGPAQFRGLEAIDEITTFQTEGLTTFYLGFNARKAPFDDVRVRQAINYALDVELATEASFEGFATAAKGPMAPTVQFANTKLAGYGYNVDKAKELLAQAGYPNGFSTTIWTNENPIRVKYAEIFQEQLSHVGITVSVEVMEWTAYLDRTAAGEHDMFMLGWVAVTGDADYGLYSLFHSSTFGDAGNRTFWSHPEVDRLLDLGKESPLPADREAAYMRAQEIIFEEAPWVFLAFRDDLNAVRGYVVNFKPHAAGHHKLFQVYNN